MIKQLFFLKNSIYLSIYLSIVYDLSRPKISLPIFFFVLLIT